MRHGSLFSGIGGFVLAAEWMGWENVFHCEWNPFGQKVLKYYWPNAISYEDITKTDFTVHRGKVDIITGGFPCQPYSLAGKRKGKEDERHLWPQMLRTIREVKPSWIVGENVYGLVNWSGGLVFHEVQSDLEVEGYEVFPFLLPACSINAPHRRDRIWFVAYANNKSKQPYTLNRGWENSESEFDNGHEIWHNTRSVVDDGNVADANNSRQQTYNNKKSFLAKKNKSKTFGRDSIRSIYSRTWWDSFPSVSPICVRDDGFSDRLDGITFPKWRNESIKAGGNAIVPQVAYQIFKTIQEYERIRIAKED